MVNPKEVDNLARSNQALRDTAEKMNCFSPDSDGEGQFSASARGGTVLGTARVVSVPTLSSIEGEGEQHMRKRLKRSASSVVAVHSSPTSRLEHSNKSRSNQTNIKPEEYLRSLLSESNVVMSSIDAPSAPFLPITKQQHYSYPKAAFAARNEDLGALKQMYHEGNDMQCSNSFGESILHIICRRGNHDILCFLLDEAKVTVRVRDDLGRTPLHDAAWTDRPNFRIIKRILSEAPDLLFIRDNRGFSALAYIPSQNWSAWNNFLSENKELYCP